MAPKCCPWCIVVVTSNASWLHSVLHYPTYPHDQPYLLIPQTQQTLPPFHTLLSPTLPSHYPQEPTAPCKHLSSSGPSPPAFSSPPSHLTEPSPAPLSIQNSLEPFTSPRPPSPTSPLVPNSSHPYRHPTQPHTPHPHIAPALPRPTPFYPTDGPPHKSPLIPVIPPIQTLLALGNPFPSKLLPNYSPPFMAANHETGW